MAGTYRFSFGPWNIHEGADPFGPTVRPSLAFSQKLKMYKQLGFDGVQFHDDDAVPDLEDLSAAEIVKKAAAVQENARRRGPGGRVRRPAALGASPTASTAAITANDPQCRRWAIDRSKRAIDIANALGTRLIVLWLAREGTYVRESKNAVDAHRYLIEAHQRMLGTMPQWKSPSSRSPTSRWTTPTFPPSATPWPWPTRQSIRAASAG